MATRSSFGETDLSPRRVGIHLGKLACRSDAVDEGQTEERLNGLDFGARARSTGPPHEREAAHPGRFPGRTRRIAGRATSFSTGSSVPEGQVNGQNVAHRADGEPARHDRTRRSNKGMKLTKLSAAWLPGWACRLMPAPAGSDAGTASQLIPGVRPT
jgi:hypothetical protein